MTRLTLQIVFVTVFVSQFSRAQDWIKVVADPSKFEGAEVTVDGYVTLSGEGRNIALLWFDKDAADYGMHGFFILETDTLNAAIAKTRGTIKSLKDLKGMRVNLVAKFQQRPDIIGVSHGLLLVDSIGLYRKREKEDG